MSFADERQYIETRFADNWTLSGIAWGNVDFNTPEAYIKDADGFLDADEISRAGVWVRLNILNGNSSYRSINKQTSKLHTGVINVQIFVPLNTGSAKIREHADTIGAIFDSASFNGIKCDVASMDVIGSDNEFYQVNVNIPYRRDEV